MKRYIIIFLAVVVGYVLAIKFPQIGAKVGL